ncbi:MAG: hypothetical protein A3F67_03175 [Verrucomicrobia bacterium RIFCSPHIGHO2_12_FULL_41_10]|nr:MAG: hypothetical protein A3F67_03175 [Verrucomicrobia bacterium RIFCSPHIGHO2_12_FULL_41_10]HLB33607.1 ATP-binding cassette domain-containing protein [Chthoniobacterales bacterium]
MNPDAISISEATICLGGHDILRNVTASIAPGEFIGILGPNGSGKTTLIRALLGLIPFSTGRVSLFNQAPGKANHLIGYMPQTLSIPRTTSLNARSLVTVVQEGNRWGVPWNSMATCKEVDKVLELTETNDYADVPFNMLSGGEKQRILLAQALLSKPRLLLLDEPLASLDPHHQGKLVQCIHNIKVATGATILFISHDINPLLGMMDRVLYMAGGSAIIGTVEDVVSSEVLSKLYNGKMHVVRAEGRVFIVNAESNSAEPICCHHS